MNEKWDRRFLKMAEHIAEWSKDPSTKCGSVIIRPDRTIASMGYNGFPRAMGDLVERYNDRDEKYPRVIHAEMNAILNAREPLKGYSLYVSPFSPCERCAVHIIQTGIQRVVTYAGIPVGKEHWKEAFDRTKSYFDETGYIEFIGYDQ